MKIKEKIGCGTLILGGIFGIIFIILMFIHGHKTNFEGDFVFFYLSIAATLFLIGGLIMRSAGKDDQTELRNTLGTLPTFDSKTGELKIFKRSVELRKIISIKEDKNYTTKDDPVKVHYGSATVGGVTTGGVYTTGGGQVFSGSYSTGKAYLEYNDILLGIHKDGKPTKGAIHTIRITPEMYNSADSSMKEMIGHDSKGYYITVIENAKMNMNEIRYAMSNLTSGHTQDMVKRGYPSRAKCEKILNWLAS